jgi:hypothetical protein
LEIMSKRFIYYGSVNTLTAIFEPEYLNILNYAIDNEINLPSLEVQQLQNTYLKGLKDAGIWNKKDVVYVFASDGVARQFALINWKNPNQYLLVDNAPTGTLFEEKQGFRSPNTSGANRLESPWRPVIDGPNYTLNQCHLSHYVYTDVQRANAFDYSVGSNSNAVLINPRNALDNFISRVNSTSLFNTPNNNSIGFYTLNRIDNTQVRGLKNGMELATQSISVTSLVTNPITILTGTGGANVSTRGVSKFSAGGVLTDVEALTDNNLWYAYYNALQLI